MATKNPRITITLAEDQHKVLQRLAELQGGSMSRIVSELLAEVSPMLERLCDTLDIAKKANAEMRASILHAAEQAEADLRPIADAVQVQFDEFSAEVARQVAEGPRPVITGAMEHNEGQNTHKSASPRGK